MNQFQSSLYLLTESVGAVAMVSVEQIVRQQNLDYLEHLCLFIDRMNINPVWFENESTQNKLKMLQIYQWGINYSKNYSQSCKKDIQQREAVVAKLRQQQKQKIQSIRGHKDYYCELKEKYKAKKHFIYKYTYDLLRNKLRNEEEERQYRRVTQSRNSSAPEIVYYYPQPNGQLPYDPMFHQQQHHYQPHPYPNYPPPPPPPPPSQHHYNVWPSNHPSNSNSQNLNPFTDNRGSNFPPGPSTHVDPVINPTQQYNQFLQVGKFNKNLGKSTKININLGSQHPHEESMQKSQIIASGEEMFQKAEQSKPAHEQVKLPSQKSMDRSKKNQKRESVRLQSREDEDQFGDLTANSKKRDGSIKLLERNSDVSSDQSQFDSIAHIKLTTDNSNKYTPIAPNRFQSKIHPKEERSKPSSKAEDQSPNLNYLEEVDQNMENILGFSSTIAKSKFSKNNKQQEEGEKLFDQNPPKRNSQNRKSTTGKNEGSRKSSMDQSQKSNHNKKSEVNEEFEGQKLYNNNKPKRNNYEQDNSQLRSIVKTVELSDKGFDIYHSNVGQVQRNNFKQKAQKDEQVDIYTSNRGSGNSKASGEKMHNEKPKRASQIEAPPQPSIKKSNNQLKIPMAQSQEMKNSNKMLYSQAVSIKFTQENNPPPKLQKQPQPNNEYEDDFDDDIEMLEKSRLPISHQKPKQIQKSETSEVKINIQSFPTNKEISKQKYVTLANETFELKKENNLNANNAANLLRSSNTNLAQSDNFFDEILQIPMNSKIAKRPAALQNHFQSKIQKKVSSSSESLSLKGVMRSPSIHVIDPSGHMQRVQQRGVQQGWNGKDSAPSLKAAANSNKSIDQRIQKMQNEKKGNQKIQQKKEEEQSEEQIQFDLIQQSQVGKKQSKIDNQLKEKIFLETVNKIETQPPVYKDSKNFDEKIFDKLFFDKFKAQTKSIKNPQKWSEIQAFFRKQNQKSKIEIGQESESASTPKNRNNNSFDDDLDYSLSNMKMQSVVKNGGKKEGRQPIKEMTESITIKDVGMKMEQQKSQRNSIQNKYSRGKPKSQVKKQIIKNIYEGKNAYDVDDQLNVAAFQNKNLLEKKQDSDDDF